MNLIHPHTHLNNHQMTDKERRELDNRCQDISEWRIDCDDNIYTIDQLTEQIQEAKDKGATHFSIVNSSCEWGDGRFVVSFEKYRADEAEK